jgi:vancomycin resistance protein VanJ
MNRSSPRAPRVELDPGHSSPAPPGGADAMVGASEPVVPGPKMEWAPPASKALIRRLFRALVWSYFGAILAYWAAIWLAGDRTWWGTILVYLPSWPSAAPLVLLVPGCVACRGRHWLPLALTGLVILFPLAGLQIPWRKVAGLGREKSSPVIRVLTCNLGSRAFDEDQFAKLIDDVNPDIITIQERASTEFLTEALERRGYHVAMEGRSFLTASKYPLERRTRHEIGWNHGLAPCTVDAPFGSFDVINTHLTTPRWEIESILRNRFRGLEQAGRLRTKRDDESRSSRSWLDEAANRPIIAGDFNLPTSSAIYRRDWSDLRNAFTFAGWGLGTTKHSRFVGKRIDHVLTSGNWWPVRAWVERDVGSDHYPLVADIEWLGATDSH